ncbi:DUF2637 domain-containing protein (plasmid) [Streptomyces sp. NBC_01725]|uniref:DUF2637 domain-containing protein n=1 Tax=Streptomyces sp. NBC_01725 TaxID=2975923 RepID=UPI002E27E7AD|nr:DUF2637 domain-containing protein [Streptomyces sp. NBC_01725]
MTETQMAARPGATAGAAPGTAPAAPVTRSAAPVTTDSAPPAPRKGGRARPGSADTPVSTAPAADGAAPANPADPPAGRGARTVGWLLLLVAGLGMPLVGVIGFAASYSTLERFAAGHGFSDTLAPWFPIGIDASIVALLALDLVMVRRKKPWPLLRFAAHAMTLVTVLLNASDGLTKAPGESVWAGLLADPLWALSHGVMPILFVLGVEAARRLLMHAAAIEEGTETDRIPLHRWALAPVRTGKLYRRMRLAAVRSYPEMVERERALAGYRVWLTQELGGDLAKASEIQMLPITMAPHGYTVEEALALPAKWKAEAAERDRLEAERARLEAERQRAQAKADRIAAITDEADIKEATFVTEARTGTAQAQAEAAKARAEHQRTAAERLSLREAEALESEEAASARRRAAEETAEAERLELEAAQTREQAARIAADAARREEETGRQERERASARRRAAEETAEAERLELEAERLRAELRQVEAAAEAAEDYLRLQPRERNARRVARMLLVAHPAGTPAGQMDPERVPSLEIGERLGVGRTVAGELRKEALALLAAGYADRAAYDAAYEPRS